VEILVWTDVEGEVSLWCEQMFPGKEKGCFSPWLIDTFWEYVELPQSALQIIAMILMVMVKKEKEEVMGVQCSSCHVTGGSTMLHDFKLFSYMTFGIMQSCHCSY
jgi:hypothetical protein